MIIIHVECFPFSDLLPLSTPTEKKDNQNPVPVLHKVPPQTKYHSTKT